MKRLGIAVEGATEREFVNRCLAPRLREVGWDLCRPVLLGKNGGSVSIKRIREDVRLLATQFDGVTTLVDLYAFQGREGRDAASLEADIAAAVGNVPHFIPYVQQFEFEALLFSDVEIAHAHLRGDPGALHGLKQARASVPTPEHINDGYETCPSRRLGRAYAGYDKFRQGPAIAEAIGLARIRAQCLRFDAWVTRLEKHLLLGPT